MVSGTVISDVSISKIVGECLEIRSDIVTGVFKPTVGHWWGTPANVRLSDVFRGHWYNPNKTFSIKPSGIFDKFDLIWIRIRNNVAHNLPACFSNMTPTFHIVYVKCILLQLHQWLRYKDLYRKLEMGCKRKLQNITIISFWKLGEIHIRLVNC